MCYVVTCLVFAAFQANPYFFRWHTFRLSTMHTTGTVVIFSLGVIKPRQIVVVIALSN